MGEGGAGSPYKSSSVAILNEYIKSIGFFLTTLPTRGLDGYE